ncbi:GlyGly-CTERM sorting domain-containing protein [Culicoidibacter larvae]|uniref:GlyGly-CTERM sorting domain-containing protein n=1 Tax=Culicoidibacter larvae TaxID=2579976 RepID=A0A5R8Q8X0_9FIRM|nr:GlyGly-CTERM sorting domain-containing protein [Culicoidibacter larvae]
MKKKSPECSTLGFFILLYLALFTLRRRSATFAFVTT